MDGASRPCEKRVRAYKPECRPSHRLAGGLRRNARQRCIPSPPPPSHEVAMVTGDVDTRTRAAHVRSLRALRIALVIAGVIAGVILPFLAAELSSSRSDEYLSPLDEGWLSVLLNAGFGALAGWALGALVAHLLGER